METGLIIAVVHINVTWEVVILKPEKIQALTEFDPML